MPDTNPVLSGWLWWVYNYQTLAAGLFAVFAAFVGACALRNQTNNQRKIAEAAARRSAKAAIAALLAEVRAMQQHSVMAKNGAVALAKASWEQNPAYIHQFRADIPDIFKYYYRDAVGLPVRTATKIFSML
jgi:hypothetical protein